MSTNVTEPQFLEHACDATRLLAKRRALFDIKERFAAEKAKYDKRCSELKKQEEELKQRDLDFQRRMVKFKLFAEEKKLKQSLLERRHADEVQACEELDTKAAALTKTLDEKRQELERLQELAKEQKYREKLPSLDAEEAPRTEADRQQSADETDAIADTADTSGDGSKAAEGEASPDATHALVGASKANEADNQ